MGTFQYQMVGFTSFLLSYDLFIIFNTKKNKFITQIYYEYQNSFVWFTGT